MLQKYSFILVYSILLGGLALWSGIVKPIQMKPRSLIQKHESSVGQFELFKNITEKHQAAQNSQNTPDGGSILKEEKKLELRFNRKISSTRLKNLEIEPIE